jgi:hypothetical protein
VQDELSFCYRIFFSVDLIGSTEKKFKQLDNLDSSWITELSEFIDDFPSTLDESFIRWKTLGDEILFYKEVHSSTDILLAANKATYAINKFNRERADEKMKCKGTIWGAGFPVTNRAIYEKLDKEPPHCPPKIDFVGPSIDLGFRLSKFSTQMKMVVSFRLACRDLS